jgi:hypothetical protein
MNDVSESQPRWRFRFSIRSLLILAAFVGLGFSSLAAHRRVREVERLSALEKMALRQELAKYRQIAGYPEKLIPGRVQIEAIELPLARRECEAWRIFVPEGARFAFRYQFNDVPSYGFPQGKRFEASPPWILEPGMTIIAWDERADDGEYGKGSIRITAFSGGVGSHHIITADDREIPWRRSYASASDTAGRLFNNFAPDEPIQLVRWLSEKVDTPTGEAPRSKGLMLWLKPIPPEKK